MLEAGLRAMTSRSAIRRTCTEVDTSDPAKVLKSLKAAADSVPRPAFRQYRRNRTRTRDRCDLAECAAGRVMIRSTRKAKPITTVVVTTPGRMYLAEILPRSKDVPFSLINRLLTKREITQVIDEVYRHCGQKETCIFADRMMSLGFGHAARAGISFGKDDLVIPDLKHNLINDAQDMVKQYEQQYLDGLITKGEKYNKVVDVWSTCTDEVADEMMKVMSSGEGGELNAVYMMAHSGARGSAAQIKQLAGMRGLMAKPSGEIIETPIISNFKEGLSVLEYFNSTHGARKGLADTALKTANSVILAARRLVDVAQDCIIIEDDCGTDDGLTLETVIEGGEVIESLSERIVGRFAADDVVDPLSGEVIVERNQMITEPEADAIETAGLDQVRVRSPLTCASRRGVCSLCYGRDWRVVLR